MTSAGLAALGVRCAARLTSLGVIGAATLALVRGDWPNPAADTALAPLASFFLMSACAGLLLAWVLTFEQGSPNQLLAAFCIGALLLFAHYASSTMLNRSIFIIHSYLEGVLLFVMTMASFRLGDQYLGITSVSVRTEIFLFLIAGGTGIIYVWSMRRLSKPIR